MKEGDLLAEYYCGQFTPLFCCPSIFAQAFRAAIVAAELPLCGKPRAEATNVFIDQRILEAIKKEANNRQAEKKLTCLPNTTVDNSLRCFADPQYLLKRFALRLLQLNCRFAASSAPKLQLFSLTNASWK